MTTIYFAGGEDECMVQVGGGTVVTTAGTFRSGFARCALSVPYQNGNSQPLLVYWSNGTPYSTSAFWQSVRLNGSVANNSGSANGVGILGWADSSGVLRLAVRTVNNGVGSIQYLLLKANAAGTVTQLGSQTSSIVLNTSGQDKIDCDINYSASGHINVYLNGSLILSYSGDITTDSVSSLAYSRLGQLVQNGSARWSELIVSDSDTRSWGLQTFQPVANGNTHNFDTGTPAAANVNETTLDDTTYDGSTTAGQIDQYTIPALATGYGVVAFGVSARAAKGATGPTKMDLGVRVGGSDYWSADQALAVSLLNYQNWWLTNPNTTTPWVVVPDNIGLKSVT